MPTAETPASREILTRAEKRLAPMIARRGIDAEVLAVAAMYDDMYRRSLTPAPDDLTALVEATAEPIVAPALLDNARTERARRMAVAR